MLQNRVDPYGNIIFTPARGAWMGNRGLLHDAQQHIRRPFRLKAWIICVLQFKGRHRPVMAPGQYTELFFLDEATALSAGHRPCAECRREDFNRFKAAWIAGNPEYGFTMKTPIGQIDEVLHAERTGGPHEEPIDALPDGTFVVFQNTPHLLYKGLLRKWSPEGYGDPVVPTMGSGETDRPMRVLTPASTVNAIRAGYCPQVGLEK